MLIAVLLACSQTDAVGAGDTSSADTGVTGEEIFTGGAEADALYDPLVMHELVVDLDPDDWAEMRVQARTYYDLFGEGCMDGPFDSPYTYFSAEASYDGESLGTVAVRKKGLIGSVISERPSLKIKMDEYVDGQTFHGLEKLVFNNGRQDLSRIRTCLAHHWFDDAGLVAPRCALAHVVVNGEDLGVYASTENIDENLIGRRLGEGPTSMYEGTLSDFREGWMDTFEHETDESTGADISAVTAALESPDGELLSALNEVIDLDEFFTFWAAEVIAGHWDGYTGNTNNFYVYSLPSDQRLHFLASGPDAAFDSSQPFGAERPTWITTTGVLANRLAGTSDGLARFEAELERQLDENWQDDGRLAEVDSYADLAKPYDTKEMRSAIATTRDVIAEKAGVLRDDIDGQFEIPALRGDFCFVNVGTASVEFATTWGSYPRGDLYTGGEATANYNWYETDYLPIQNGVSAGIADDGRYLWLTISALSDTVLLAPYVVFDPALLTDDSDIAIDGSNAEGALLYFDSATMTQWATAAYLGGTLHLDVGSDAENAEITGYLQADILANGG